MRPSFSLKPTAPPTMTSSCSRPQRQPLRLLIDSSLPQGHSSTSPESTYSPISDSSLTTSGVTPSTGNPEWFICNVICMFDFESDDPHHLPFTRNEILTIVKMEESGWWAAMRPKGDRLGWIPSSFVERLTESTVDSEELDKEDDYTRIHGISETGTDSDCLLEEILNSVSGVAKSPLLSSYQLTRGGPQDSRLQDSFFSLLDDEPSLHGFTRPVPSPLRNMLHSPITPPTPVSYVPTKPLDTPDLHSSSVQNSNFSIDPERDRSLPRRPRRLAVLVNDSDSLSCLSAFIDQDHSSAFHALDSRRVRETFDAFSTEMEGQA
ncbi:guanine nucleotide exchange factor [Rhizopogon vesiculosus]|uniref:Guanine nucleotide exchange factor n=1 Tax=Rhizopogon vesiculosus TaxID=180088 RepID=A0A1J8QJ56_9AGAM|nr:guanine nucleotide exchange factor [Rhizopogon vesiculosus]